MTKQQAMELFGSREIRTAWDEKEEKWYFSIIDVVAALTDSTNPSDYIKKMKKRDEELSKGWGQLVTPLSIQTPGGKQRMNCADTQSMFRIIQSIPSPKAEPFKQWMAQVASERLDEMADPEIAIDRAMEYYRKKGYGEKWIEQRMQGKTVRKALTDEWKRTGVKDNQFAMLTDILTKEWSGFTTREYKSFKGLKKENLRDHMTNLETAVNTLAEAFTTELSKKKDPHNIEQNKQVAKEGGSVARETREKMERQLGRSIISQTNAKQLANPDSQKFIDNTEEQ
ncbi:MAG: Bro-N domain-containing protein [Clostridium sp.]|nr:Bro-N domain-containing protein [Bacteroides sp.]MCM1198985.1 Bro-N domain-containing protein [Clostridium sp.]